MAKWLNNGLIPDAPLIQSHQALLRKEEIRTSQRRWI